MVVVVREGEGCLRAERCCRLSCFISSPQQNNNNALRMGFSHRSAPEPAPECTQTTYIYVCIFEKISCRVSCE